MFSSAGVNRQPSIRVGVLGLAIVMAIGFAGVLVDRSTIDLIVAWCGRGPLAHLVGRAMSVPPCPDPGGSWWFQGTLLCTTAPGAP